ncbi:MAG: DUF7948 domain-containing protein, partial [Planctomycetota bacterium]
MLDGCKIPSNHLPSTPGTCAHKGRTATAAVCLAVILCHGAVVLAKNASIHYTWHGDKVNIFHTDRGLALEMFEPGRSNRQHGKNRNNFARGPMDPDNPLGAEHTLLIGFGGANKVAPLGLDRHRPKVNRFAGTNKDSQQNQKPAYSTVAYPSLYDGIDLYTFARLNSLKYEFHVAGGADYSQIIINYEGIDRLSIDKDGALHIATPVAELVDKPPYVYQVINGRRVQVNCRYKLIDQNSYTFEMLDPIDPSVELIIDPELVWSNFLGGSGYDLGLAVTVDASDNIIVAGTTRSHEMQGLNNTFYGGAYDAFIAKCDPAGHVIWISYLGGTGNDQGYGICTTPAGDIVVTGLTTSLDLAGATNTKFGDLDAFATKLNSDGTLIWSTYLGGSGYDCGLDVAVGASDNIIIAGETRSQGFVGSINPYHGGYSDGFVTTLSSGGVIIWSRYVGGSLSEHCEGLAVDSAGNIAATGMTYSSDLHDAYNQPNGSDDAFVAKIDPAGAPLWSNYLGGGNYDCGLGIALDAWDNIIVTGETASTDFTAANNQPHGVQDAFVAKISSLGVILWSTYIGGAESDYGYDVDVIAGQDPEIIITGKTYSLDLYRANNGYYDGLWDAFLSSISMEGTLLWSTYVGGTSEDMAFAVDIDSMDNVVIAGSTSSVDLADADEYKGGDRDAFVSKIETTGISGVDLVVASLSLQEVDIYAGQNITVEVEIQNSGDANAVPAGPGYFDTTLYLSQDPYVSWPDISSGAGKFELVLLAAGKSHTGEISFTAPAEAGTYYIRPRTDDFDSVAEKYEYNNWGQVITVTINEPPGEPDLVVNEPDKTSISAQAQSTVDVTVRIENTGTAPALPAEDDYFHTTLFLADQQDVDWETQATAVGTAERSALAADDTASSVISFTADVLPGTYYLRALTDEYNTVAESDESNNWGQVMTLIVTEPPGMPDLQIPGADNMTVLAYPADDVTITLDVQNSGDANAVPTEEEGFDTTLYLANYAGANWDNLKTSQGGFAMQSIEAFVTKFSETITFTAPTEPGSYCLRTKVDDSDSVEESDEGNNWGPIIEFLVDGAYIDPDLMVAFDDVNDISARPFESIDIGVQVQNTGNDNAIPAGPGYFDTILYFADNPGVNWEDLDNQNEAGFLRLYFLGTGQSTPGIINFLAPEEHGTYYLRTKTDSFNAVGENNEYNNWSKSITLTVAGIPITNKPPVLNPVEDKTIAENNELAFAITATDPDDDEITYSAEDLPAGAVFEQGDFSWTPNFEQAGIYDVTFTATDGDLEDTVTITITVINTNRYPVLAYIGRRFMDEGENLTFTISAVDPDGDSITYSVQNLPSGSTFTDLTFSWTPDYSQAGDHVVTFIADDGQSENSQDIDNITITVNNLNRAPKANAGADRSIVDLDDDSYELVTLDGSASSDPDNDIVSYVWADNIGNPIPDGVSVTSFLQVGIHKITLTVTDSTGAADTDTVTLIVNPFGNQVPIADAGPDQIVIDIEADGSEQVLLDGSASTDPDGTIRYYIWEEDSLLLGSGINPTVTLGLGTHTISLTVVDDGWAADSDTVTILVGVSDMTPPAPNPSTWATQPYSTGTSSIAMRAVTGSDPSGVRYYFECVTDPNFNSGWQGIPNYAAVGLSPDTQYTFRTKTRDNSSNQNETGWSNTASAVTDPQVQEEDVLVAYWALDDIFADTVVADSSGGGNDGTAQQNTVDITAPGA